MIMKNSKFIPFVICGGIAALCNMGSRYLFSYFISYAAAIVLAYCIGLLSAFFLFKFLVFRSRTVKKTGREIFWFLLVNGFAVLQTLIVSYALRDYIFPWIDFSFHAQDIAHMIGVTIPVFTSFIGHKYLTFNEKAG